MVHIIGDTLSCLSLDEARKLGIPYLPQIIIFGDQSYRDDTEIDSDTFIAKLKKSTELPKTAAPYPPLYAPYFKELSKDGEPILVICPPSKVSGTVRSAEVAAKDFPNADIRVLDTPVIGAALGSVLRKAAEWAKSGLDADAISKRVMEMSERNRTYFLVDTLEYLQKGGRIGAAQALFGSILQVKPLLAFKGGQVVPVESTRTKAKALARFIEIVAAECPKKEESFFTVEHGGDKELAASLANQFKSILGVKDVPITHVPPAILVHGGPGVIGVSYFVD